MDRSTPLAASGAVPEVSGDAAGPSRRHPELLPDEGATGGRGSREWEYQVTAAPRAGIQEPALHAAEGPAHGGDQDRIRGIQESGLKCGPRRIPAQSPQFIQHESTGYLVEPQSVQSMAETLGEVTPDSSWPTSVGGAAEQPAQTHLTWRVNAKRMVRLFEEVSITRDRWCGQVRSYMRP